MGAFTSSALAGLSWDDWINSQLPPDSETDGVDWDKILTQTIQAGISVGTSAANKALGTNVKTVYIPGVGNVTTSSGLTQQNMTLLIGAVLLIILLFIMFKR
jgi:hypothetical protein